MKIFYSWLVCLLATSIVSAQSSCVYQATNKLLQTNHQKVNINSRGLLFFDGTMANHHIPYTYGQPKRGTAFAASTWISAQDATGNLMISVPTYRPNEAYEQGPLDATTGLPFPNTCQNYNHIWRASRWAIELLRTDFNDNGVIDNPVDPTLLQWPGKGNPHFAAQMGYALPNQDLAPFYDQNNDGLYDPMHGDYPVYKAGVATAIAEELLWNVYHGSWGTAGYISGMRLEIQQTVYALDCGNKDWLNQSFFVQHKLINRAPTTHYNLRYGNWNDFDIGCSTDDYIGSVPSKNTIYAYNADNNDDISCGGNSTVGYGINPPVQAVTLLNETMKSAIYDLGPYTGDPISMRVFQNLLLGKFRNGTPITASGIGYNPLDTTPPTLFVFPDCPSDTNGWSMASNNLTGLDARTLGTAYRDSLPAGASWNIDLVYSYHRNLNNTAFENVDLMKQQLDSLQQYYDNGLENLTCGPSSNCTQNCVYPGDANNNGIANDFDILEMGIHYNESAAPRALVGDRWYPHQPSTPIVNAYVDADGLGQVDSLDLVANTQNWNLTHSLYTGGQEGRNGTGPELYFERYLDPLFRLDTIVPIGGLAVINPHFGDTTAPLRIQGITYRVRYDKEVLLRRSPSSLAITAGGWLGEDGAEIFHRAIHEDGVSHYVTSRLDNGDYTGGGQMDVLSFVVNPDLVMTAPIMYTQVCFEDFKAIQATGREMQIGATCVTIAYTNPAINSVTTLPNAPSISLHPNPAQTSIQIDLGQAAAKSITLIDVLGQPVQMHTQIQHQLTIQRDQLPQGMYLIQVVFENGSQSTHKVIFQ
ncbi:MAG: T9SS type A sorting domain-containing protein [Aureispira sp.]